MQTLPLGLMGAAAATPLAQRQSGTDPAQQEAAAQARQAAGEQKAEAASGIGQTDQDEAASDRDADGRRIWEISEKARQEPEEESNLAPPIAKDPTGAAGNQLDISG
jgi:hypothetical protein